MKHNRERMIVTRDLQSDYFFKIYIRFLFSKMFRVIITFQKAFRYEDNSEGLTLVFSVVVSWYITVLKSFKIMVKVWKDTIKHNCF